MASVNVTCTSCTAKAPCERCRSLIRTLRAAGHAATQTTRYDALRAAAVGAYGFDACVLPVARDEGAIVDAAAALLRRSRVALVIEPGALPPNAIPKDFTIIEDGDWQRPTLSTDWVTATRTALPESDETRSLPELEVPPADLDSALRRLKGIARKAQLDLGAAGFPKEPKLDLLATLEDEIAWAKMSGASFGLALVHVANKSVARTRGEALDRILAFLRGQIESVVRATDIISQGSDSLLVIVGEASLDQTSIAASRLKKALRKAVKTLDKKPPASNEVQRLTIGSAVYPAHGTTRAALLARATAAAVEI
jgi:GGDEF domain-containing protein